MVSTGMLESGVEGVVCVSGGELVREIAGDECRLGSWSPKEGKEDKAPELRDVDGIGKENG